MADGVRLIFERDAIKADLEQAKAQAANAAAMVTSITAERDAARGRELKALRQLADLVERTSKPPAKVVGVADFVPSAVDRQPPAKLEPAPMLCSMPTSDGHCTTPATGRHNGWPFCSRHLDAIRDEMRREYEIQQAEASDRLPK